MQISRGTRRLRRFIALEIADKWLFLRAVFWLGVARIRLALELAQGRNARALRGTSPSTSDVQS